MKKYLIQKKWLRDLLFNGGTFLLVNGKWKFLIDFEKGEKIENVEGKWNTQSYCECGNELVHSQSFLGYREVKETNMAVYDYECSFCNSKQYRNPGLIPGLLSCNKNGIPN